MLYQQKNKDNLTCLRAIGDLGLNQIQTTKTPLTPDQHRIWHQLYDEFSLWLLRYCGRELRGFTGSNYDPLSDAYEAASDALFKTRQLFAEGKINPSTPAELASAIKTIAHRTVVNRIRARSFRKKEIDEDTGQPVTCWQRRELTSDTHEAWVGNRDEEFDRVELEVVDAGPISPDVLPLLNTARDIEPAFKALDDHKLLALLAGKTVESLPGVQERDRVLRSLRQRFEYRVTPRSRDETKTTRQGTVVPKTRTCPVCGLVFGWAGRGRYCSPKCRKRASRSREACLRKAG